MKAVVLIVLAGCWTGTTTPALSNTAPRVETRVVRDRPRVRSRAIGRPPSLPRDQLRFSPDLMAMRVDAAKCASAHQVAIVHTISFDVTIDANGQVTAAAVQGFGVAEPCVLTAIRARRFVATRATTLTITIPFSSAHPPVP